MESKFEVLYYNWMTKLLNILHEVFSWAYTTP